MGTKQNHLAMGVLVLFMVSCECIACFGADSSSGPIPDIDVTQIIERANSEVKTPDEKIESILNAAARPLSSPTSPHHASEHVCKLIEQAVNESNSEAIALLNEALEIDPREPVTYYYRARVHRNEHKYNEAIADFNRAIQLEPKCADYFCERGQVWYLKQQPTKAVDDLGSAIKLDPKHAGAHFSRAWIYLADRKFEDAIADANVCAQVNYRDERAYRLLGKAHFALSDYRAALVDFTKAIAIAPGNGDSLCLRADVFVAASLYSRALADYTRAIELSPSNAAAWSGRAIVYSTSPEVKLRNEKNALSDAQTGVKLADPKNPIALIALGHAYAVNNHFAGAFSNAAEAAMLAPAAEAVRYRQYRELFRSGKAYHVGDQLPAAPPEDARAYAIRGHDDYEANNYLTAAADYSDAIRLQPTLERYLARARVYLASHNQALAIEDYGQAIQCNPNDAALYSSRAEAEHALKKYAAELADLDSAADIAPNDAQIKATRAILLATCPDPKIRESAAALRDAQLACQLSSNRSDRALAALAYASAQSGDFSKAVSSMEEAIAVATKADAARYKEHLRFLKDNQAYVEGMSAEHLPSPDPFDDRPPPRQEATLADPMGALIQILRPVVGLRTDRKDAWTTLHDEVTNNLRALDGMKISLLVESKNLTKQGFRVRLLPSPEINFVADDTITCPDGFDNPGGGAFASTVVSLFVTAQDKPFQRIAFRATDRERALNGAEGLPNLDTKLFDQIVFDRDIPFPADPARFAKAPGYRITGRIFRVELDHHLAQGAQSSRVLIVISNAKVEPSRTDNQVDSWSSSWLYKHSDSHQPHTAISLYTRPNVDKNAFPDPDWIAKFRKRQLVDMRGWFVDEIREAPKQVLFTLRVAEVVGNRLRFNTTNFSDFFPQKGLLPVQWHVMMLAGNQTLKESPFKNTAAATIRSSQIDVFDRGSGNPASAIAPGDLITFSATPAQYFVAEPGWDSERAHALLQFANAKIVQHVSLPKASPNKLL